MGIVRMAKFEKMTPGIKIGGQNNNSLKYKHGNTLLKAKRLRKAHYGSYNGLNDVLNIKTKLTSISVNLIAKKWMWQIVFPFLEDEDPAGVKKKRQRICKFRQGLGQFSESKPQNSWNDHNA